MHSNQLWIRKVPLSGALSRREKETLGEFQSTETRTLQKYSLRWDAYDLISKLAPKKESPVFLSLTHCC